MNKYAKQNFASQIIKTIDDNEEVEDFSEDSEEEVDFQPSKQKKKKVDFDDNFEFVTSVEEYNKNAWSDVQKYIKRKASSKTDDKIKKVRGQKEIIEEVEEEDIKDESQDYNSDVSLSSDDLQHDHIRVKQKKKKVAKKNDDADDESHQDVYFYDETINFYQMNISRPLLKAITQMKFTHPTPIQAATIPVALLGKDIYGCAATGTGKTAAYMLPSLERLIYRPNNETATTRVLVLVPTRELGVQVYEVSKQLSQFTDIQIGLAVGGLDLKTQENILRRNPDIVVATPGRLIDHLHSTPTFSLSSIEILILDEADRMLDEYFAEQMKEIIKQCSRTRQTMLFSATMTDQVQDLVSVSLDKPVRIFVDSNKNVAFNLRQEFIRIRSNREADREPILAALVCRTFRDHCIIFVQTKKQAHRLHILLGLLGVKVAELHGNLTQPQRLDTLQRFKNEQVDVVVATDVAARGLDIVGVKTVINFVMPATLEHYIHRVGRTARAGRAGVSVSLAGEQERKIVKEVIKSAKRPVKSRIIPTDIMDKYKKKLDQVEDQIEQILKEEYQEKLLSRTENQINRAQKLLEGDTNPKRGWFQSSKERKEEKERLSLQAKEVPKQKNSKQKNNKQNNIIGRQNNNKSNKNSKKKETVDDKIRGELNKVAQVQARLAKRGAKLKKIQVYTDGNQSPGKTKNKKKSNFVDELCNTTKSNAKALRHVGNSSQRQGKGKSKQKKVFGKQQAKRK